MQVVLVVPPLPVDDEEERVEYLGLGYVGARAQRDGHDVRILDCRFGDLSIPAAISQIGRMDPRVVGITAPFAIELVGAVRLAARLRQEGFDGLIAIGGHPATFAYGTLLSRFPAIDTIVRGEGEETFAHLLRCVSTESDWRCIPGIACRWDKGVRLTPPRPLTADLDALPFPLRDNTATEGVPASVAWFRRQGRIPGTVLLSSRGCPFRCSFCSVSAFYRSSPGRIWRPRSAHSVVQEIEHLVRHWGVHSFRFSDDSFFGSCRQGRSRAVQIVDLLIRKDLGISFVIECCAQDVEPELFSHLRRGGLCRVNIGVESGVVRTLRTFNKRASVGDNRRAIAVLRDLGIEFHPNFILIDPDSTLEELQENLVFFRETGIYRAPSAFRILFTNRLGLFAGTPLLDAYWEQARTRPWRFSGLSHEDQDLSDQIGAIFDYSLTDQRVACFLRIHGPAMTELIRRDRLARRHEDVLRQQRPLDPLLSTLMRWRANLGVLALQVFQQALELAKDPAADVGPDVLVAQLDHYDHLHFGSTVEGLTRPGTSVHPEPEVTT